MGTPLMLTEDQEFQLAREFVRHNPKATEEDIDAFVSWADTMVLRVKMLEAVQRGDMRPHWNAAKLTYEFSLSPQGKAKLNG